MDLDMHNKAIYQRQRAGWTSTAGHDYLPYKEKDVEVWISAAQDIKGHYLSQTPLRLRRLWQECAVKHT